MGLFNKGENKKAAIIDRIKYDGPDDNSPWIIYKCPSEQYVLGSQLIVNQGQEALFFKGGQALDLFGPGTHTLQTGNLPLLNKLVNLPFGGDTPFSAEIYYINKTSKLDMNWGTQSSFPVEDPKYGMLMDIRAYGTYGLRINDARMFVSELVGAVQRGTTISYNGISSYFSGLLVTKVKNAVSKYMIKQKISFLEVTAYLDDISKDCQEAVSDEFDRFGAEIINFYVESVTPPKEQYEKLRVYKEENALGNGFYAQKRSFDILESMANNESSGGLANAGIGLGMGLGAVQSAGNLFSNIGSNINIGNPANNGNIGNSPAGDQGEIVCPNCGTKNPSSQKFCGNCGKPLITGIKCPKCGKINPLGQSFCGECGTKLVKICPKCGKENDPSQKFCGNCGTAL